MTLAWLSRLFGTNSVSLATPAPQRMQVCPPSLLRTSSDSRFNLRDWLNSGWHEGEQAAKQRRRQLNQRRSLVGEARCDFGHSLRDIRTPEAFELTVRVRLARSLRELWHLRPEIFSLIAVHLSQHEAQARLTQLNRHFPTRAPGSGFGALDAGNGPMP
jgi:hypothetical protein